MTTITGASGDTATARSYVIDVTGTSYIHRVNSSNGVHSESINYAKYFSL